MRSKGRKERSTPLKAETAKALHDWLHEREGAPADPVFPARHGRPLRHDAAKTHWPDVRLASATTTKWRRAKRVNPNCSSRVWRDEATFE